MISERDISEKFSAIWKQNFPLLTTNFIKVFNDSKISLINSKVIELKEDIRYDLISEISFNLAEQVFTTKKKIQSIIGNSTKFDLIVTGTAQSIWKSGNYSNKDLELSSLEIEEITLITKNILEFISNNNGENVIFKPKLMGYGFIPDLQGDISIDDTLYEIKTINRNFKSSDLKQLFLYLALKQVTNTENWTNAGLYNPRKGIYYKFNVKKMVYKLTGGKTPNEAFENLLNGLVRDVELDSRF